MSTEVFLLKIVRANNDTVKVKQYRELIRCKHNFNKCRRMALKTNYRAKVDENYKYGMRAQFWLNRVTGLIKTLYTEENNL
jgi:hypothetical protein